MIENNPQNSKRILKNKKIIVLTDGGRLSSRLRAAVVTIRNIP